MKKIFVFFVVLLMLLCGCEQPVNGDEDISYSGVLANGASYAIETSTATIDGKKITSVKVLMTMGEKQCGFSVDIARDVSLDSLSGWHDVSAFIRDGQTFTASSFNYFPVILADDSVVSVDYTSNDVSEGTFAVSGEIQRPSLQQLAAATRDAQFVFANQSSGGQIEDGIAIPIPYDFFKVLRKYV